MTKDERLLARLYREHEELSENGGKLQEALDQNGEKLEICESMIALMERKLGKESTLAPAPEEGSEPFEVPTDGQPTAE